MSFPTVDKLGSMPGKKEGEVRVFREGMVAKAFAWQGGQWTLIGDVQG
jgi:phospholipase A-2-activating protein